MKIRYCSDLHLEINGYHKFENEPGDKNEILLVAGDFVPAAAIAKYKKIQDIFEKTIAEWDRFHQVIIIPGNHDYYHSDINKAEDDLLAAIEKAGGKNVLYGNKIKYDVNGVIILGATLWTDFDRNNEISKLWAGDGMNDYYLIKNGARRLKPNDTYEIHQEHLAWIASEAGGTKKNIIVMSHHAPSYQSSTYTNLTGAYCSDLSSLIWEHPNIIAWVHGHTHTNVDYEIHQTRVVTNQRGYYNGNECYKEFSLEPYIDCIGDE